MGSLRGQKLRQAHETSRMGAPWRYQCIHVQGAFDCRPFPKRLRRHQIGLKDAVLVQRVSGGLRRID